MRPLIVTFSRTVMQAHDRLADYPGHIRAPEWVACQ